MEEYGILEANEESHRWHLNGPDDLGGLVGVCNIDRKRRGGGVILRIASNFLSLTNWSTIMIFALQC